MFPIKNAGIQELARGLSWKANDKVIMTWAYYDESGEYDRQGNLLRMTVGGCMAPLVKWESFETAWKDALMREGLEAFHMTDFEAWKGPFDFKLPDGSRDKERHNHLLNSLLDIMLEYIEVFYGYSSAHPPKEIKRQHGSLMEDCVIGAVSHAVHEGWEFYQEPLNLVFAKQKHFPQVGIQKYAELYDYGEGKGRIKGTAFYDVKDICALQAADIMAYEMTKIQRDRPERYPFKKLRDGAAEKGILMTLKWGPIRSGRSDFALGNPK